eukprot:125648-Alexandrium_andersonii.AAC.1
MQRASVKTGANGSKAQSNACMEAGPILGRHKSQPSRKHERGAQQFITHPVDLGNLQRAHPSNLLVREQPLL